MRWIALILIVSASSLRAADYYVNSREDGIARVNRTELRAGDRVLFEGGQTFSGTLRIGASGVSVSSYGSGRATIDGGNGSAIRVEGCSRVAVRNLKLTGSGRKGGNTESGLVVSRAQEIDIEDVEVTGFRSSGVAISGSRDVRVLRVHAYANGFAGISSDGKTSERLRVAHCLTENNAGDPTARDNHSGNGIVIGHTRGAVVERCEARYNGWDMPWTGNGPVGIWSYESDNVTIQYCVSHHNRSTAKDGGGFDFDGGMTNSVLQYNYSHDNFGSGYLICQYDGAGPFANNVVRYNISQDDGLMDHNAGIYVWVGGRGMKSTVVHNNTIFNNKGSAVAFSVVKKFAEPKPEFDFHDNIFVSLGPQIRGGAANGRFARNLYWSVGERGFSVDRFRSLEEWARATGQEKGGLYADPLFVRERMESLTDPAQFQLLPGSPAIGRGAGSWPAAAAQAGTSGK